jgi:hypothetical protein
MLKSVGIAAVVLLILVITWYREYQIEQVWQKQHDECIAWATHHVYPDGRTVAQDVDPEAWCQD